MRKFGLQVYIADLVGLSIIRELGPLMVAMICIGRAGSAFAAELGTMKVSEELDAIKTMGLSPARFLVLPKIAALTIVMPMLVVIGDFSGIIGGIFITSLMTDITISAFYQRLIASLIPQNILESIVKGFIF
ncbi:MAG: ABC transporter permease, partial [Candidatus Nanoarchaeia archaeon]